MLTYSEQGKYGVQTTFYFAFEDAADAETPFVGAAPVVGDIWLSKDGGAPANATNAMTAIGNGVYSWVATAAEMQATRLNVNVYDATASAIFLPIAVLIKTKLQLGQIDVDATAIGGNTPAIVGQAVGNSPGISGLAGTNGPGIKGTGNGTGSGIEGAAGATGHGMLLTGGATSGDGLRATTVAGTSYGIHAIAVSAGAAIYADANAGTNAPGINALGSGTANGITAQGGATGGVGIKGIGLTTGAGIMGTGGVTGHGFHGVGGATSGHGFAGVATTSGYGFFGQGAGGSGAANWGGAAGSITWDDLEGAEPTAAIPSNATFRQIMQHVKRAMLNFASESATKRTIMRDDSVTPLETQDITSGGGTKTRAKAV